MKNLKYIFIILLLLNCYSFAQETDTTIVFQPAEELVIDTKTEIKKSWGIDLLISTNGFGLGAFYGLHFTDEIIGKINLSISESKDEREVEYYDYYTGRTFVPYKVNRFLVIPLLFAVEYRLFKDEIMDNFRPYVSGAIGPSLIFSTPYEKEFFNSLKYGRTHYTIGGYIGAGAFFGSDLSNILGVNVRYYYIPHFSGIESLKNVNKKDFGGFSISLSFGTGW